MMKLKYYMRGLGIGIIVSAILMGFITKNKGDMSDEEIKARAAELGMVEEQMTLADMRDNLQSTQGPADAEPTASVAPQEVIPTVEPTIVPTHEPVPAKTPTPQPTEFPIQESDSTETPAPKPTEEPKTTDKPKDSEEIIIIQIERGDHSERVSRKLEEAGLIQNAMAFNSYLKKKKLEGIIDVGTFEIPMGTSEEEIARIITD